MVRYEAVLFRDNGDGQIEDCKTLLQARKALKKMIDDKPYQDAYIRRFELNEDGETISTKDYEIK